MPASTARVVLAFAAFIAVLLVGAFLSRKNDLPDAHTWRFFSESKIRARLFYSIPGVADSILVSNDPACCPVVSPNGRWVACTAFNSKAIETELLLLSRQSERWGPFPGYSVIAYDWSPDGMSLAGYGKRRTAGSVCFFAVQPLSKTAWFPDSILKPEDYDFAWDSTSTRVAICRPSSADQAPSEVLVYSLPDHKMTTLATLDDGLPTNPRWLPNGALVVTKEVGAGKDSLVTLRFTMPVR